MTSPLAGFLDFCPNVLIPSRDAGLVPLWPFYGTQTFLHQEIERGLAEGVHDFTVLKGGRQVGGTTYCDALSMWYLQVHNGLIGMYVSDDEDNRDYRRDVLLGMLESLPAPWRQATRMNNRNQLAWLDNRTTGYKGSRLVFGAAGKREGKNLGRSKGINFNINDEVGSWQDPKAYAALRASRSKAHPLRLYIDVSTARGIGSVFHDAWLTSSKAVARRAIFLAWWRHDGYRIERSQTALWARYGEAPPTRDEVERIVEVQKRYGVLIGPEQLAWARWQLTEDFEGDEALMAQEYGWLPEECFQAFGDKFIEPHVVSRMRRTVATATAPKGYDYEWGDYLTDSHPVEADPASAELRVWEECDPLGVYVVSAHPWGSSSADAKEYVVQVWRAWPDRLAQVAEYALDEGYMHKFAWVCLHMCGAYRSLTTPYFILEIQAAGIQVLAELERMDNLGYGLEPVADRARIANLLGSINYLYRRLDTFMGSVAKQMKSTSTERQRLLYALRDEIERGHVEPRSPELVDQLAGLRRGEEGDSDQIGGGGAAPDARAYCAALAVEVWLQSAMADLPALVAPRDVDPALRVENVLVGDFLGSLMRRGE